MKNYLAFFLAAALLMALATSSFAVMAELPADTQAVTAKGDTKITIQGELRIRGWDTTNVGNASTQSPDGHSQQSASHANTSPSGK